MFHHCVERRKAFQSQRHYCKLRPGIKQQKNNLPSKRNVVVYLHRETRAQQHCFGSFCFIRNQSQSVYFKLEMPRQKQMFCLQNTLITFFHFFTSCRIKVKLPKKQKLFVCHLNPKSKNLPNNHLSQRIQVVISVGIFFPPHKQTGS